MAWNTAHPSDSIGPASTAKVLQKLRRRTKTRCRKDACWAGMRFARDHPGARAALRAAHRPAAPCLWLKKPREWLTSDDITKVMRQYETAHPHFRYLGSSPIDFDARPADHAGSCVWPQLCSLSLKRQRSNGKTALAAILNADPHHMDGSHWMTLFIDIAKDYILFFDSTGDPAPPEVTKLVKRLRAEGEAMGKSIHYYVNRYPHQRQNTECGVYGLYAVSKLLAGTTSPSRLVRGPRIADRTIWRFRKKFFNTPTNCAKSPKE